jgi:hypothetical protein
MELNYLNGTDAPRGHLATAFQLAGFPHVVASNAALALHHAVRARRSRYPATPFLWAGYLQAGA